MADEIFVGSVSVGVVPDLRGFNDKMRAELVPSANRIGQEIGREMARGIMDELNLGRLITEATSKAQVVARRAGFELGRSYGRAMRRGIELEMEGMKAHVKVDIDTESLAKSRVLVNRILGRDVTVGTRASVSGTTAKALERAITGGAAGGGGAGGVGLIGGLGALLKALPGGTSGSIGAVPAAVGVPAGIAALVALPFAAQMLAGLVPAVGGAGLAGLGIAGAFGAGATDPAKLAEARKKMDAANARVVADEFKLNALRTSGKATIAQIAQAEATLASARSTQQKALDAYTKANRNKMTVAQQDIRAQLANLGSDAVQALQQIGLSFVPVLQSFMSHADDLIGVMTPVFSKAVKTIAGPFKVFGDTIIKTFGSPQVQSSIQAVAKAFADVMVAFTPDIPGIINSFADAIERIANAVAKNPKAFADFLNFFFQLGIVVLDGIAALTNFADYVEMHFIPFFMRIGHAFVQFGHGVESVWDAIWRNTVVRAGHGMHDLAGVFDSARHNTASVWDRIYNDTIGKVVRLFTDIKNFVVHSFDKWWADNGKALEIIWGNVWRQIVDIFKSKIAPIGAIAGAIWKAIRWEFTTGGKQVSDYWHNIWNRVMTIFRFFANEFRPVIHGFWVAIVNEFKITTNTITAVWHAFWNNIVQIGKIAWATIKFVTKTSFDIIVGIFTVSINLLTGRWGKAWNALKNMAIQVWNNLKNFWGTTLRAIYSIFTGWYGAFRTLVINSFKDAANWLVNAGGGIVHGLMNGIKSAALGIGHWVKGTLVDPIVNAVKGFFGIHSPATIMIPIGINLVRGVITGMITATGNIGKVIHKIFGGFPEALAHIVNKGIIAVSRLPAKALHAIGSVAGKIGGFIANIFRGGPAGAGVEKWLNTVKTALMLNNLPDSFAGQVLFQMRTESGGNANAINLTDINAQRGDPSRGLMQVIGSTFAAYHVPGTSSNIYDPLANIAAAINYAKHVYGPTLMRGGMGLGSGHGYDAGGWLPTGTSIAHNLTGRPELVLSHDQLSALSSGGGTSYIAHFDSLTGAAIESHVRVAFQAMALTQGSLQRQGRRSL